MAIFTCTTCGSYNTVPEGQQYAVCPRCGTWFYLHQPLQNPFSYSPPTTYNYRQPQSPVSKPEPQEYIPKVPVGNRYAGHDKVIAKMAKDYVDLVFRYIEPDQWHPVSRDYTNTWQFDISFDQEKFGHAYDKKHQRYIYFISYGMRSIPDIDAFQLAIEPALLYYFNEKARTTFKSIHRLSDYRVKGGSYSDSGRLKMKFYVFQVLHPDELKTW